MKIVGRIHGGENVPRDVAILQRTLNRLRGGVGLVPRGVHRFGSFEEAESWMTRQIVASHGRRSSKTSSPSAGL
jgi:hypothetical protein